MVHLIIHKTSVVWVLNLKKIGPCFWAEQAFKNGEIQYIHTDTHTNIHTNIHTPGLIFTPPPVLRYSFFLWVWKSIKQRWGGGAHHGDVSGAAPAGGHVAVEGVEELVDGRLPLLEPIFQGQHLLQCPCQGVLQQAAFLVKKIATYIQLLQSVTPNPKT